MANTYANTPVLSKVKIGSQVYYVKDADVRALLDTYGDIVTYNVEATLSDGNKIPTGAAVTAAINNAVVDLAGAMHFEGVSSTDPATGTVTINGEVTTSYVINDGDTVTISATLSDGYELDFVNIDNIRYTTIPQEISPTKDISIYAQFRIKQTTPTPTPTEPGTSTDSTVTA